MITFGHRVSRWAERTGGPCDSKGSSRNVSVAESRSGEMWSRFRAQDERRARDASVTRCKAVRSNRFPQRRTDASNPFGSLATSPHTIQVRDIVKSAIHRNPMPDVRSESGNVLINAIRDPSLCAEQVIDAAWKEYCKAGCPYGESKHGLAIWVDRITWIEVK